MTAIAAGATFVLTLLASFVIQSMKRAQDTRDLALELRASVAALNATLKAVGEHVSRLDDALSELPCRQCEPYEKKRRTA